MSLLDNIKDKYQEHQEKTAELKDQRGDKLGVLQVTYMGGYGDQKKATGTLIFYQNQTEFRNPMLNKKMWFTIANSDVADVAIEGKDDVNRRVTVTRLVALGIFAFAIKKKSEDKDAYVTLVLADGQEAVFHVKDKAPMEVKTSLAKAISQVKQAKPPIAPTAQGSAADELTKLAKLKEQGIITQDEFDKKKTQLLGL